MSSDGSAKYLESSASDFFFDCNSRFSVKKSASSVEGSHTGSPNGYFEKSSSFYPAQYTIDDLFSDAVFVFGIIRSDKYYHTQKYFFLHAETPRQRRSITVSATFDNIQDSSAILGVCSLANFDVKSKLLPKVVWNQLNMLLPRLDLFKSDTKPSLSFQETESGQIVNDSTAFRSRNVW